MIIKLIVDFLSVTMEARDNRIFPVPWKKKYEPRILYSTIFYQG